MSLVPTLAEATDLIELTRYNWSPEDEKYGVGQTWAFYFRPLDMPDEPPRGPTRPGSYMVVGGGKTLAESTEASGERIRDVLRPLLLPPFRSVVPK